MVKPTKGDFDRAVAQPWSATTCLVAQLMIRQGLTPARDMSKLDPVRIAFCNRLSGLMHKFDVNFPLRMEPLTQENRRQLSAIRKSLPRFNWPWQRLKIPAC